MLDNSLAKFSRKFFVVVVVYEMSKPCQKYKMYYFTEVSTFLLARKLLHPSISSLHLLCFMNEFQVDFGFEKTPPFLS